MNNIFNSAKTGGANGFPVGFLGKLPVFPDFVSFNASGREGRALHQWLQEGLYACRNSPLNWPDAFYQMPRYSFLYNAGSMESYMVGCFGGSEDQTARKYPFIVFTTIIRNRCRATLPEIPLAFSDFLIDAYSLINCGWAGMDAKGLTDWAQNRTASAGIVNIHSLLTSSSLDNLFTGILGGFDDDRKFLIFQSLIDMLMPLRNRNTQRFTLGLRLPLSQNKDQWALECGFWLQVIFRYLGQAQMEPVFFWNTDNAYYQPFLFVYLRPPAPRNFIHIVQPNLESDLVCNLDSEGINRIDNFKNRMNPQLKNWLEDAELNLADFVERFISL